jgi:hypothetical protein
MQSNGRFVNSVFEGNSATGVGMNSVDASCPGVGHPGQSGAGLAAAARFRSTAAMTPICWSAVRAFVANTARELAGALFRHGQCHPRRTTIDRSCSMATARARAARCFVANLGAARNRRVDLQQPTPRSHSGPRRSSAPVRDRQQHLRWQRGDAGVGGALYLASLDGASSIRNATFANNRSMAGGGYFAAAMFGQLNFPIVNTVLLQQPDPGTVAHRCSVSFSPAPAPSTSNGRCTPRGRRRARFPLRRRHRVR